MKNLFGLLFALFLASVICLLLSMPAQCGITGEIKGEVKDANTGEPLPFADILISGPALLKPYAFSGDKDGKFVRAGLPPGTYTIEVVYVGYVKKKITGIKVTMDRAASVTVELTQRAALEIEVEVVAASPLIEKEVSSTSDVIEGDYIEEMPIEGQSYQGALKILPGTYVDRDQQVHIRGGRTGEVGFRVDGVNVQDPVTGGYGANININAIEKMEVMTGGYDAEYGGNMSGMVNVVTKSGTDTLHGDVHYNYDNSALDGVGYESRFYNPGFTLKGPIIPEKLDFFLSFDSIDTKLEFPAAEWPQDDFGAGTVKELMGLGKLTWQAGINDKFEFLYILNTYDVQPPSDWIAPVHMITENVDVSELAVIYTHTFSPELFLQTSCGMARWYVEAKVQGKDWHDYEPFALVYVWDEAFFEQSRQYGANGDFPDWEWREVYDGFLASSLAWYKDDHAFRTGFDVNYINYDGQAVTMPYYLITSQAAWNPNPGRIDFYLKRQLSIISSSWATNYGGAYLQDSWNLNEKYDLPVHLNYGFRYDWQASNHGSLLSPLLGASYSPDDKTTFHIDYGWFFQVIPLTDAMAQPSEVRYQYGTRYVQYGPMYFDYNHGAAGLRNPVNKAFEVGVDREIFSDITLGLTYFDKDMQDMLQNVDVNPDPSIQEWQLKSLGGAWAQGLEVKVKKAFSEYFEARLAYTYQEAKGMGVDMYGAVTGKQAWLDWDVRHSLALSFMAQLPYSIFLNGIYSWNSGYPYTRDYLVRDPETDQLQRRLDNYNENRIPYYSSFDLSVSKEFKVRDYTMTMMVQSFNLFDQRNVAEMDVMRGKPAAYDAGRRLVFGVKLEF